jgi:TPR repeat protein
MPPPSSGAEHPAASLDGRTDLYALGGLLFEMLTGQTPFHAENYEGWARRHQTTPPQPPSTLRPDLANWQGLDALVLRLLAKDRDDRPNDVAELLGLIDDALKTVPKARSETITEPSTCPEGKKRSSKIFGLLPRWLRISAVVLVSLAIFVGGLAFGVSASTIAKTANKLDDMHQYSLGGLLRNFACTRGEGESCFALARTYYLGRGVATDYSRAASLYSRACDAGNSKGCGWLGAMYEGQGLAKDAARAAAMYSREVALLSKACDAGDPSSCNDIGDRYRYDFWGKKDFVRAAESFSKACDGGSADGCKSLGSMYLGGVGVPKDFYKAVALQTKACNLGDGDGCFIAALAYQYGRNIEKNTGRARELYQKFCAMGEEMACAEAAKLR